MEDKASPKASASAPAPGPGPSTADSSASGFEEAIVATAPESAQLSVGKIHVEVKRAHRPPDGYGRFHLCLFVLSGLIYAQIAVGVTTVSFVLPAATCDFQMDSAAKGWLSASPLFGTVLGSYFWGNLADSKGRKAVLVVTLLLDGCCGILSSLVQYLEIFMLFRITNGFAEAGAMGICFPYLGEFQPTSHRETVLCWMEMFWTTGMIILILIAWAVIPLEGLRQEMGTFTYDTWNMFVAACGVPSVLLAFWLMMFPESPRFLIECGENDAAMDSLKTVYHWNTGDSPDNYPIRALLRNPSARGRSKSVKQVLNSILYNTKEICKPPHGKTTLLTCFIQFGMFTNYLTLVIWFPELFNRFEDFEHNFPNETASVCIVSGIKTEADSLDPYGCLKRIDPRVYHHTLILGCACIPTALVLPLFVRRFGAKFFLIVSVIGAGIMVLAMVFVVNVTQNLIVSAIFEALTSLATSLIFCVLVDLYPTNLRVMASALSLTVGKIGGLAGSLSFGYLIDLHCLIPIICFAVLLIRIFGSNFEDAIAATGYGRFHFCLLAITGLIYAQTAVGVTIISFVLPAAACDFKLDPEDMGWLTAAPMLGMVLGSYFWGALADTKGRKIVLVTTLLLDGITGIVSSGVQYLFIFMLCRLINGFAVAGAMGICFPYLGEFQTTKYRETVLCWMEMFWTFGIIILPCIAWAIIPIKNVRVQFGGYSYDSWNWFIFACGVPSVLLGLWLLTFPESPRFIMECGDYEDALKVFKKIYHQNTGDDPDNYPIRNLEVKQSSVILKGSTKSLRNLSFGQTKDLKMIFYEIWHHTKQICSPPHLKNTIIACLIQFGVITSYYTLIVWFPELFELYEEYENAFPNKPASVCDVTSTSGNMDKADPYGCLHDIDPDVYKHTLYVGLACIPTSLWLPLCVHRLGAKFFLISSAVGAGASVLAMYYIHNSQQFLAMCAIFEATTSLATSLIFCVLVDMYPTNLRVMAAALSLTVGRTGGLVGNLIFGYLIEMHCLVPIVCFSGLLFMSAILCLLLPKTGGDEID